MLKVFVRIDRQRVRALCSPPNPDPPEEDPPDPDPDPQEEANKEKKAKENLSDYYRFFLLVPNGYAHSLIPFFH